MVHYLWSSYNWDHARSWWSRSFPLAAGVYGNTGQQRLPLIPSFVKKDGWGQLALLFIPDRISPFDTASCIVVAVLCSASAGGNLYRPSRRRHRRRYH
jgi:hypothetical protein